MVFRVNKTDDYTVMANHHLRDMNLSLKAKGLLSVMLSLSDTWDYSIQGLCQILKDKETVIRTALKELENGKYLIRTKVRNDKGIITDWVYDIYECPHVEFPQLDNPQLEKPHVENQGQINTNILNTEEINKESIYSRLSVLEKFETPKNSKSKKKKYGEYGRVKLTDKEYENLINEFGEEFILNQIKLLDEYVESNNNKHKYTNFNLVLRKSIREKWFKSKYNPARDYDTSSTEGKRIF